MLNKKILGSMYKYIMILGVGKHNTSYNILNQNAKFNQMSNTSIKYLNTKILYLLISKNFNFVKNYSKYFYLYNMDTNRIYNYYTQPNTNINHFNYKLIFDNNNLISLNVMYSISIYIKIHKNIHNNINKNKNIV